MKKIVTLAAAASLALTMAATSFAKDVTAPGQNCAGLTRMSKQRCMRAVQMKNTVVKMEKKIMKIDARIKSLDARMTKRAVKELERQRQRTGGVRSKVKSIIKDYVPASSSSSSKTSSSSSSATSSSAGAGTSSAASSAMSSSASSQQ